MLVCEGTSCFNQVSKKMHFNFKNQFPDQNCFSCGYSYWGNSAGLIEMVSTIVDFMDNADWNFNRFINSLNIAFNYILEGIKSVRYF